MICNALATRYEGKGNGRKVYTGTCVLDMGHEGMCLPNSLAMRGQVVLPSEQVVQVQQIAKRLLAGEAEDNDVDTLATVVLGWEV